MTEVECKDILVKIDNLELLYIQQLVDSITNCEFIEILSRTANVEKQGQIKFKLRISNESRWLFMVDFLKKEEERSAWGLHICREYIRYHGRLGYVWNFILQSKELNLAVRDLCRVFDLLEKNNSILEPMSNNTVTRRVVKIDSYPVGKEGRNRTNSQGKGADYITGNK